MIAEGQELVRACLRRGHATRADFLRRLGRREEAATAYGAAIARTANRAERSFLEHQRSTL